MYQIEKGVEIPDNTFGKGRTLYPFQSMEVGDSFFVPFHDGEDDIIGLTDEQHRKLVVKVRRKIFSSMLGFKKSNGGGDVGFTARTLSGGIRVWRVR